MWNAPNLINLFKQHEKLNLVLHSHNNHMLPGEVYNKLLQPHRMANYFFIFVDKGSTRHLVDMNEISVHEGQILFLLPHQIHVPPASKKANEYYKISFDDSCLKLLPKWYPFLINPFNSQVIDLDASARNRLRQSFVMLEELLLSSNKNNNTSLLIAWLHTIMTEVDQAYFNNPLKKDYTNNSLAQYIQFKQIVEQELTEQPSIDSIAKKLSISTNSLYALVKQYAGISPKEYFTNRIMLEAQRLLFYATTSAKELAFELGFSDPDYFSRLFKKHTGKSITLFLEEVQDLSGKNVN